MLREGIEAALIVGIVASYLKQSGRAQWLPMVWLGVGAGRARSVSPSASRSSGGQRRIPAAQQELFEGLVALLATAILTSMVFWMKKAARSIKAQLHDSIDNALRPGDRQGLALVGMVFFAVGREGLESVFFLLAIVQQSEGFAVPIGAALGLASAVGVGFAIYYGGVKLESASVLPLDRRLHHFRRRRPARRRVARLSRGRALERLAENGLRPQRGPAARQRRRHAARPASSAIRTRRPIGEVIVYFAFLIPALIFFLPSARPRAGARAPPEQLSKPNPRTNTKGRTTC